MPNLSLDTFLEKCKDIPVVDVRTPAEYNQGHIPGAINIPLFSNEERAEIGTIYKQGSKELAVERGLEIIGPRMKSLADAGKNTAKSKKLLVHCWRGGMRSESFAWLMNTVGIHTDVLSGGYKTFRRAALDFYDHKNLRFILLGGATGSGKTEILHEMQSLGEQVVDLEGLANHKGSAFGGIGKSDQPTSEQFQNQLYIKLLEMDLNRDIWLENESSYIGKVGLPEKLWKKMIESPILEIKVPKTERVKRLVREHGTLNEEELTAAILKISKKLGPEQSRDAIECLKSGEIATTANLLLTYYDKSYDFLLERRMEKVVGVITFTEDHPQKAANYIIDYMKIEH